MPDDTAPLSASRPEPSYVRPQQGRFTAEVEIKRSRFIALAECCTSEDEAREFISSIRREYPDARHHCSAFVVHVDSAQPIERSSDDGEPAGTAGQPMLEVLKGWHTPEPLQDVAVVVVRYFGGVKLGTGGLVRAYQEATREVLQQVPLVLRRQLDLYTCDVPHADAGRVEAEVRAAGYTVVGVEYKAVAELSIACEPGAPLPDFLASITSGAAEPHLEGQRWIEDTL
ncbi:IMPACT family protein [Corynebacterium sp. LK28]|uniref:IMPACT family protein n=1 Tax=Corynebacterium TaxID=1716 RepID=UPI00055252DA|nr:YigZ family protein [Corynebacterium sp. LK28]MBC6794307.1 YigZ family protein [Corynebacterium sp. LK28]